MLKKISDYFTRRKKIDALLVSLQKQCIDQTFAIEVLVRMTEERLKSIEHRVNEGFAAIQAPVSVIEELARVTEERSRSIKHRVNEGFAAIQAPVSVIEELARVTEERSRSIEDRVNEGFAAIQAPVSVIEELARVTEERSRSIEHRVNEGFAATHDPVSAIEELARVTEERSRSIEHRVNEGFVATQAPLSAIEELVRVSEERSRSIEYQVNEVLVIDKYQIDLILKNKIDEYSLPDTAVLFPKNYKYFSKDVYICTEHSLALQSNDYMNPQSTMEGLFRPTEFVMHCINNLGDDIKVMDVGVGAAGLVFEFLANGIFAVGVDGADYCRKHKIGYWPLISDSLFNADITKPFYFLDFKCNEKVLFNLITSWECLEHIDETDLPTLFKNIINNLTDDGYFIGSISTLPYVDEKGQPYHLTVKSKQWWSLIFNEGGLEICDDDKFNKKIFYRGNGPSFQDKHNYFKSPSSGFHFVARKIA